MRTITYALTGSEVWTNVALVVEIMVIILAVSFVVTLPPRKKR